MTDYDDFNKVSPVRKTRVPSDRRTRNPLLTKAGFKNFLRLKQHAHAPIWNFETGDRIEREDKDQYHDFRKSLDSMRKPASAPVPPEILEWVKGLRDRVMAFQKQIPSGMNMEKEWADIPTLSREDIVVRIETLVPLDADLTRMIVYDTSGTTGHAMVVPHHPAAQAKVLAMMEYVMGRYKVMPRFGPDMTACLNVGAQVVTVVFPTVLSVWQEAAFAKVNFHPNSWRTPEDANRFFRETAPLFLTGDPVGFEEMLRWEIDAHPGILLTTALTLPDALGQRLRNRYACPVVDWYAVTEVGPIGYMCAQNSGFHILPHDLHVEIVDAAGHPVPTGGLGEITVTGGRNPYLPLLRYRTGDWARLDFSPCPCGDPMPRIVDLQGREPVKFFAEDDSLVNPVDIGRLLRNFALIQHEFVQRSDRSCDLTIRPIGKGLEPDTEGIASKMRLLFGEGMDIRIHVDPDMGNRLNGGKVAAYQSEISTVSKRD